jgi:hypothetical protein
MFHVKHRAGRVASGAGEKWFHVKHRGGGPEHTILQNSPMHQKIVF